MKQPSITGRRIEQHKKPDGDDRIAVINIPQIVLPTLTSMQKGNKI
jgi:hypothetical protein